MKGICLFFGGNGEHIATTAKYRAPAFHTYGLTLVSPEYPGFGLTPGPLDEALFMEQAEVAGKYADKLAKSLNVPLVVIGSSLGTFSAVHVASLAEGIGEQLILHAPLTTLVDVAAELYW